MTLRYQLDKGEVFISNTKMTLKTNIYSYFQKKLLPLIILLFSSYHIIETYNEYIIRGNNSKLFGMFLYSIFAVFGLWQFINEWVLSSWKRNIALNEITDIYVSVDDNETILKLKLSNNKKTILNFRTLENQVEPFIEQLKKRNSRIKITHERI